MTDAPSPPVEDRRISPARGALIVFALAVVARAVVVVWRWGQFRAIVAQGGNGLLAFGGSDVPGWIGMAHHLSSRGDLSHYLMAARPPLFPLTMTLIYALGGESEHGVLLQALFGALTPVVGYLLARRLFLPNAHLRRPERLALAAGVVMALDPASVSISVTLLGEPLFNLLFTATLLHLVAYVQDRRWPYLALSALWMGLAMLARPTAIYWWLAAPLILIPLMERWWRPALALAVVGLGVYLGWSARNLHYNGVFTYSLQDNFSLLFLRALSAEHLATGRPPDELYVAYVDELLAVAGDGDAAEALRGDPEAFWEFQAARTPELYEAMRSMAIRRLLRYWPAALLGTGIGAVRMFAYSESLPRWFIPIELIYHAALYGLSLLGAWIAWRRRDWPVLLVNLVPIVYVTGLTLVSVVSGTDSRMRTPISVPIVVLAAYGWAWLRARRAAPAEVGA